MIPPFNDALLRPAFSPEAKNADKIDAVLEALWRGADELSLQLGAIAREVEALRRDVDALSSESSESNEG